MIVYNRWQSIPIDEEDFCGLLGLIIILIYIDWLHMFS